jgi:hypothetical protein
VHKCTNSTRDVHHLINGRRKYSKWPLPCRTPFAVFFYEKLPVVLLSGSRQNRPMKLTDTMVSTIVTDGKMLPDHFCSAVLFFPFL